MRRFYTPVQGHLQGGSTNARMRALSTEIVIFIMLAACLTIELNGMCGEAEALIREA